MLSLIIPVYRNEENLPRLLRELEVLAKGFACELEVVFVVDGSPDNSMRILEEHLPSWPVRSTLVELSRNFGSFSAIVAGLGQGTGDYFAVLAADLQEPPEMIVDFHSLLAGGEVDVVFGHRTRRADPWWSQFLSECFWGLYRRFAVQDMPKGGVDVFGCARRVRDRLIELREANTNLIALLLWLGFRRGFVAYERRARMEGRSAWTFGKKFRYAFDSLFNFTDLPIRLLLMLGAIGTVGSVFASAVVFGGWLFGYIRVLGYTPLMLIVAGFGGLTALGLGVIGQYMWLSLQNVRNRPNFVVRSTQAFVPRESADAGEKIMNEPIETKLTESPANFAGKAEISSPETKMPAQHDVSPPGLGLGSTLLRAYPFILIISVAWLANFLHFISFGYYEDDWYYFPSAFGQSLSARLNVVIPLIKSLFQGRPVLLIHETVFSYIPKLFSSISLAYVLAFLMLSATALLFYRVLRVRFPRLFCTLASLLFVLSPLTTVRQDLMIELMMGPAFIGILVAVLIRRRRPVLSYLLAIVTLLTYESVFMLFLGAPLLERGRLGRRKLRALALHLASCTAILAAFALVRQAFGEQRLLTVAKLGPVEVVKWAVALDLYYTLRSFWTYVYAASVSWREISLEPVIYICGFLIAGITILFTCLPRSSAERSGSGLSRARAKWWLWNGCVGGLLFTAIGFLTIYFQTSGNLILFAGRDTRFSASAVPGSSVFVASLLMLAMTMFQRPILQWIGRGFTIFCLSVLFVYSFVVQYDYIRAWDYQKSFLSQLVLLTPDLQQDGLIAVRTVPYQQPGFAPEVRVGSIGWQRFGIQVSLKCLGNWSSPEILFFESDDWGNNLQLRPDGRLYWKRNVANSVTQSFAPGRVILVNERADGMLSRVDEMVTVDGTPILQVKDAAVNLARGKPTRQSSTFGQANSGYGVDGILGSSGSAWGTINESHFLERLVSGAARTALKRPDRFLGFHTNFEPGPWWEVDLGRQYSLERARIFNGQPLFYRRAATIRILLSEDSNNWRVAYDNAGKVFGPEPLAVNLGNATARYVRVQLAEPNWLHLEEVEVFGR